RLPRRPCTARAALDPGAALRVAVPLLPRAWSALAAVPRRQREVPVARRAPRTDGTAMSAARVLVLAQHEGALGRERALRELLRRLDAAGLLAAAAPRAVVDVGHRWRSDLVVATARALASAITERSPSTAVMIADAGAASNGTASRDAAADVDASVTIAG